eukprot:IDg10984t1
MKLSTLLSALALILGLLQGVLALESTHPARISYRKLCIMLALESLEFIIVLVSEILTYNDLSGTLRKRIGWLKWLAPSLLGLGLLELTIDAFATFRAVSMSRALWVPIYSLSSSKKGGAIVELLVFCITTGLTVVLVGWRQALWWRSTYATTEVSLEAARNEIALSTPVFAVCTGFALAFIAVPAFFYIVILLRAIPAFNRAYHDHRALYWSLRTPELFWRDQDVQINDRMRYQYRQLCKIQSEAERKSNTEMSIEQVDSKLKHAPLHLGNTLLGDDCKTTRTLPLVGNVQTQHFIVTLMRQIAMVPLLALAVCALFRMRKRMDRPTYNVFVELADAF